MQLEDPMLTDLHHKMVIDGSFALHLIGNQAVFLVQKQTAELFPVCKSH